MRVQVQVQVEILASALVLRMGQWVAWAVLCHLHLLVMVLLLVLVQASSECLTDAYCRIYCIRHAGLDEIDGPPFFTYLVRGTRGLVGARPGRFVLSIAVYDPVTSTIRESDL